jgi:hypothetical protein
MCIHEYEQAAILMTTPIVAKRPANKHAIQESAAARDDLTGIFCTSGSEREFTLEGSWYADQEIQAGADRDAAAAG